MNVLSFEDRAQSGRYDQLASLFDGDSESLATVDFGTHFTAEARSWHSGDVKNYTTTFSVVGGETRQELVVNLIGEVTQEGTELRAKGNAWLKADDVITDKTSAKDVIVLKLPSLATPSLEVLYENQICTLEAVCDAALPAPVTEKKTKWVRTDDKEKSSIVVTFPAKYKSPDSHFHLVKPKLKRSLTTAASGTVDTRPDPEVGGLYEPSLLADYDTTLFKFKSAKLAQQEVYTPDGDLVAPWDAPNSLRPGTLVAVEANLIVYTFCRPKDPSTAFQIQARRVQILDCSPLPQEEVVVQAPITPAKKTPSKLFALLSTPPQPVQATGGANAEEDDISAALPVELVDTGDASTSATHTPDPPVPSRASKRAARSK